MLNLLLLSISGIPKYTYTGGRCVKAAFGRRALTGDNQTDRLVETNACTHSLSHTKLNVAPTHASDSCQTG